MIRVDVPNPFEFSCNYTKLAMSLPPANEVWGKVIFSQAGVKNSVHGGGSVLLHAGITPPLARRPTPGKEIRPGKADPPQGDPPPGKDGRYGQRGSMHPTAMQSCFVS